MTDGSGAPTTMPTPPTTVSVLIVARQRKQYIARAVRSVLDQVGAGPIEILVVKDFPEPFVDGLARDGRVVLLPMGEEEVGASLARGASAAHGSVIAFLDDDDTFEPTKIRRVEEAFSSDPKLVYFHTGLRLLHDDGAVARGLFHQSTSRDLEIDPAQAGAERAMEFAVRHSLAINLSSVSVRRTLVTENLVRLRGIAGATDYNLLYVALASGGRVRFTSEVLGTYFIHASAMRPARPDGQAIHTFIQLVGVQKDAHAFGMTLPPHAGTRTSASCLYHEWEFLGAVVEGSETREVLACFGRFLRASLAVRPRLAVLATPVLVGRLLSHSLGLRILFAGRHVVHD